jgi:DNA-binding NarL/FixJ family response regulator
LSDGRLREAIALVAEWHDAPDLASLAHVALPGINSLLGGDAAGWNAIDLEAGTLDLIAVPGDAAFHADLPVLEALIGEHPLVPPLTRDPSRGPMAWADVISSRGLSRLQIFNDFFRPHGIGGQLAFALSKDPWIGIAVNRRREDFSPADRELASLLRLHLSGAYRSIAAREAAARRLFALEQGMERAAGAVVVVGPEDTIEHASPAAWAILGRWFASGASASLPAALRGDVRARAFHRPEATLRVTRLATEPQILVLDERRSAPEPGRAVALGLTRRESEVLELVARGLTNAEIAAELAISRRTVHKHLENSYAKIGVGDRGAAAELLLRPA